MTRYLVYLSILSVSVWLSFCIPPAYAAELYFIDAHSQVDDDIGRDELIRRMTAAGISKSILSSRRQRSAFDMADWAEQSPDKIVASVRVKGKPYSKRSAKYYKKLEKQLNSGRFHAMSEVLLYHAQKGDQAGEVIAYPDDPRVTAALAAAKSKGWPLVIHIEFASLSGGMREKFYNKMQTMLQVNPDQPFALNHMGQLDAETVADLLARHNNLYFLTAHCNPLAVKRSNQPWVNMFQGRHLAPAWQALMIKYPDRFIFALDNVWAEQWRNGYKEQVDLWREALQPLPVEVAQALAHGNAERLWKLK